MTHNLFETTLQAKPKSTLRRILALGSVTVHVMVGGAFLVLSLWEIQELQRPGRGVAIASPMQISAPSGGGGAKAEPERVEPLEKPVQERVKVSDRQPNANTSKAEPSPHSGGSGTGDGSGDGDGDGDGDGNGDGDGLGDLNICFTGDCAPPVPVAVLEEPPIEIQDAELRTMRRVSGEAQIQPDTSTKNMMSRAGDDKLVAIVRMCLDNKGKVVNQRVVQSSGHPGYDAKLKSGIRKWRYEPYRANGKAVAICTQLTFVYRQD